MTNCGPRMMTPLVWGLLGWIAAGSDLALRSCAAQENLALATTADSPLRAAYADLAATTPYAKHPLLPAIRYAQSRYDLILHQVQDYTCLLVKRERVNGRLQQMEYMTAKVRHRRLAGGQLTTPFGVYLKFLAPGEVAGREVLYVEGQNRGQMIVTKGGRGVLAGATLSVDPRGSRAMADSLYPITEIGILNLGERLMVEGADRMRGGVRSDLWQVKFFKQAKINGRSCTMVQLHRAMPDEADRLHTSQIFIDDELQVPIRYVAYRWPADGKDQPELMQEYTYTQLKLNVGLTDTDFARSNPDYGFRDDEPQR